MDDPKKTINQLAEENKMLRDALDAISKGFIVFNAADNVVAFNTKHKELFPSFADLLDVGVAYRDLIMAQAKTGQFDAAVGREEAWTEDWIEQHQKADGTLRDQIFADGKHIRLSEHRMSNGGIVAVRTEITDLIEVQRRLGPVEIHRVRMIVAPMWIMASKLISVLHARIAIRLNSLSF